MMVNKKLIIIISLLIIIIGIALVTILYFNSKIPPQKPNTVTTPEITIYTDKTIYKKGEIVKINVENRLDKSIWYIKDACPPSCCNLFKWENTEWKNLGDPMSCIQVAQPPGKTFPIEANELKSMGSISKQWHMTVGREFAESGKYRFSFYYGSSRDDYTSKTIYSNEFSIK